MSRYLFIFLLGVLFAPILLSILWNLLPFLVAGGLLYVLVFSGKTKNDQDQVTNRKKSDDCIGDTSK